MAPRSTQKPKADPEPSAGTDREAFDADAKANKRADAPITIGKTVFHRRRKTMTLQR